MSSGNKHVKVVVRTRPTIDFAASAIEILPDKNIINVRLPKSGDSVINNQNNQWSFKVDKVMHITAQDTMYEECAAPIVRSVMEGYNGTLLAYGQTGAGKTFTMTGTTENYRQRGIIPRAISHVFREVQERPQYAYTLRVSFLEIYNETLYDLLAPAGSTLDLNVVDDKNGCYVRGLTQAIATCEEDALNMLFEGETNRSIGDHALNRTSSRSHCIFTIHVESKSRVDSSDDVIFSKLNLVDLAGSERLAKTNSSGRTLKEAMFINKSLTFLEQVIIALADKKRDHVPFRQSRLTNVLRDSLGGNCNTLMVANIWGEAAHLEETISTLRFATRMMCVTNEPMVNVQYDPLSVIKKQEREIRELRQELAMHDTLLGRSHIQYEPLTDAQRTDLTKRLKAWLEGGDEDIDILTLRQAKEIMSLAKSLYHKMQLEGGSLTLGLDMSGAGRLGGISLPAGQGRDVVSVVVPEEDGGVGETDGSGFSVGVVRFAFFLAKGYLTTS
ncbi:P-loop containing nucleoside triphosphate hydrolase protein [Blastocladiella britannica]|nr:P-loop containing nucleoside triphosphate hydrolase protein [Blastocladiella britannica]